MSHYELKEPVMKKNFKSIYLPVIILMMSFSMAAGQDKKSEEKIKIIVEDGTGTKTVIDTVFKDSMTADSIRLKDGTVIFLNHNGGDPEVKHQSGKEHVYVTVSSDGEDDRKVVKKYTIVSSDSAHTKMEGHTGDIMVYNNYSSKEGSGTEKYQVTTTVTKEHGDKGEVFYITKSKGPVKESEDKFDVYVSGDDHDSGVEKSKFIIAKDGMVVTIEGNDETKARELAKEVEAKLGIKGVETEKPEAVKSESEKTKKK